MAQEYNWKRHYSAPLELLEESPGFRRYYYTDKTGYGYVRELEVFDGLQIICNDLYLYKSGRPVSPSDSVIEITYCLEGRYECEVNDRYCFYLQEGDMSVGSVGRVESRGYFPTGRFKNVTMFVTPAIFVKESRMIVKHLGLDMNAALELANSSHKYFILHQDPSIRNIMTVLARAADEECMPRVKLAALAVLRLLSELTEEQTRDTTVYLNRNQIRLAKAVHERLASDLSGELTIARLSEEFGASPTSIKSAFKSVYGVPVNSWYRHCRLETAQRLLWETDMTAAEIAHAVGYTNPGKFSSAFHEMFGVTPTQYRSQMRQQGQVP